MTADRLSAQSAETVPRALRIAILAMGGEGGGVLADWLVDLAEHAGWVAQTTSVPGVAQRTGATIYYVELFPGTADGPAPVLAMMPTPGDVDLVVASELMEGGRALQRGLVTPERTTLVMSTHRVYSMTEKIAMGDGRVDAGTLLNAARAASRRLLAADFAALAEQARSVISAALFGAVAASGALPFTRAQCEDAIRRGGIGVDTSLAAFAAGFAAGGTAQAAPAATQSAAATPAGSAASSEATTAETAAATPGATPAATTAATVPGGQLAALAARLRAGFPATLHGLLDAAIRRLAEFQDVAYAGQYLDRLQPFGDGDPRLLEELARQLGSWMAYDDAIRVATVKTGAARLAAVRREVRLGDGQLLQVTEFLHPRLEEIADILPAALGRWLLANPGLRRWIDRPRAVQTTSLRGFLLLRAVAALRPLRRRSLRFAREQAAIDGWLDEVARLAAADAALALAYAGLPRVIKGYGDTHRRGHRSFTAIAGALPAVRRQPAPAASLATLLRAALADEEGRALDAALKEIAA